MHAEKIIRYEEIQTYTGISAERIKDMVREGRFPRPIKLTEAGRRVGWLESTIAKWQQERFAQYMEAK